MGGNNMWKNLAFGLALATLVGFRAEAADNDLQQIADALDVSTTKTFQFTGNGSMYALGQSTSPAAPWPRFFVKSFTRVYDFTSGAMRDDVVRMAAEPPTVGPEQRVVTSVSGDHAWNGADKDIAARLYEAPQRAHEIVISPHGLLRAAFASNAVVTKKTIDGRPMTVISFTYQGKQPSKPVENATFKFKGTAKNQYFQKPQNLIAVIDDASGVVLGLTSYNSTSETFYFVENMSISISYAAIQRIVQAKTLGFQLGVRTIRLTNDQLNDLRAMAAMMTP